MEFAITTMAPAHKVGCTHIDPETVTVTPIEMIRASQSNYRTVPLYAEPAPIKSRRRNESVNQLR